MGCLDSARPPFRLWLGELHSLYFNLNLFIPANSAAVIGLYTSYVTPIFLRITSGREGFVPGPFSLGKWYMPIGMISVSWVSFIVVLLLFPPGSAVEPETMSKNLNLLQFHDQTLILHDYRRLCRRDRHGRLSICFDIMGDIG